MPSKKYDPRSAKDVIDALADPECWEPCPKCGDQPGNNVELQPDGIHTIPVPQGWSVEQAWEAISRGDTLTDPDPFWAVILVKDGKLAYLYATEE